jgi:uncharacterized DUF497 family protein
MPLHFRSFEFDPGKSAANLAKHGLSLAAAAHLWNDPDLSEALSRYPAEPRRIAIGLLEGKHWTVVFTHRANTIRLISARRSRENEKQIYEAQKGSHDR